MENEGQAVNRPPLFNGNEYDYWKQRMITFFDAQNIDLWDVVETGYTAPVNDAGQPVPRAQWTADQRTRFQLNSKARHYLMCAITKSEYDKVHSCTTAKEMWDTLALAHEGSSQVRESKISILVHQYELFKMEEQESIDQMFGRFQTITNNLRSLGKVYTTQEHVRKILRSLPRQWRPKVTAIQEARDLSTLALENLLGSLKVHELELNEEGTEKRAKSIALKAQRGSTSKALRANDSDEESCSSQGEEDSDEDELSFISKRIKSMWKKKGGFRRKQFSKRFPQKEAEQKEESPVVCYGCRKPGHYKADCPEAERTKKKSFKKKKRSHGNMGRP